MIATDRQAPRIYPRMILLCSHFDSVLFTPKRSAIATYGNYSRSPEAQPTGRERVSVCHRPFGAMHPPSKRPFRMPLFCRRARCRSKPFPRPPAGLVSSGWGFRCRRTSDREAENRWETALLQQGLRNRPRMNERQPGGRPTPWLKFYVWK